MTLPFLWCERAEDENDDEDMRFRHRYQISTITLQNKVRKEAN